MIRRCKGWVEPKHPHRILGEVEPLDDKHFSDGMCDECAAQWDKSDEPEPLTHTLTVYTTDGRRLSKAYPFLEFTSRLFYVLNHMKGRAAFAVTEVK